MNIYILLFIFTPTEPASFPYSHHQYEDENYPGICFLGKPRKFTVDSKGGHFAPPEYGISLSIPPDAVPPGEVQKITIQPCVSGPFKYPEGYEPLSAVYLITPKATFQKKVELRLDHYGRLETDEQASQITFWSANTLSSVSGKSVYRFRLLDGGKFTVHETYGALELKHFCLIGAGTPKNSDTSMYVALCISGFYCFSIWLHLELTVSTSYLPI